MQCGIAIYPSKEVRDFVNSYRKRFDPYYSVIAPHLTIREKEDWSSDKLKQASLHLEEITKKWAPFSIHFNRFSSFYPANNVIYLALSDPNPVTELHAAINSGVLGEQQRPYVYNPHVTIGQKMDSDELHDVLASLRKKPVDYTSLVEEIHLFVREGNSTWNIHQTFKLRG